MFGDYQTVNFKYFQVSKDGEVSRGKRILLISGLLVLTLLRIVPTVQGCDTRMLNSSTTAGFIKIIITLNKLYYGVRPSTMWTQVRIGTRMTRIGRIFISAEQKNPCKSITKHQKGFSRIVLASFRRKNPCLSV